MHLIYDVTGTIRVGNAAARNSELKRVFKYFKRDA
jgi:hypothetical protein